MTGLDRGRACLLIGVLVACSSGESAHEEGADAGLESSAPESGSDSGDAGAAGTAGASGGAGAGAASGNGGAAGSSGSAGAGAMAGAAGTAGSGGTSAGGSAGAGAAGASGHAGAAGSGGGGTGGSPGVGDGACEPSYDAGVYDPFPGNNSDYPTGPVSSLAWVGEDFDGYGDGDLVEQSSNKSMQPHIDVTSGALYARYVSQYRRGWTSTYNFRVLGVGNQGGEPVRWTDQTVEYRGYIWAWHPTASGTNGLHVFARYQTENDLYVASLRYDGKVTIKKKHCGDYTTLASKDFGIPEVRTWYRLRFQVAGTQLTFSVNGNVVLTAQDDTFSWGTHGIRTDYADVYFDDWKLLE